jgi:hypothetical protein
MRTARAQMDTKRRLETALCILHEEYRRKKLKLNADKTQMMRISLANENNAIKIIFNGQTLEWQTTINYLGVQYDKKLTFNNHVEKIQQKADQRLACLRRLCSRKIGMPSNQALIVYKAYIRPCIEWGCEAFLAMSPSNMTELQTIQNKALRICLRRSRCYNTAKLHEESTMPDIQERLRLRTIKFLVRTMQQETDAGMETAEALFTDMPPAKCPSVTTVLSLVGPSLLPSISKLPTNL